MCCIVRTTVCIEMVSGFVYSEGACNDGFTMGGFDR